MPEGCDDEVVCIFPCSHQKRELKMPIGGLCAPAGWNRKVVTFGFAVGAWRVPVSHLTRKRYDSTAAGPALDAA